MKKSVKEIIFLMMNIDWSFDKVENFLYRCENYLDSTIFIKKKTSWYFLAGTFPFCLFSCKISYMNIDFSCFKLIPISIICVFCVDIFRIIWQCGMSYCKKLKMKARNREAYENMMKLHDCWQGLLQKAKDKNFSSENLFVQIAKSLLSQDALLLKFMYDHDRFPSAEELDIVLNDFNISLDNLKRLGLIETFCLADEFEESKKYHAFDLKKSTLGYSVMAECPPRLTTLGRAFIKACLE